MGDDLMMADKPTHRADTPEQQTNALTDALLSGLTASGHHGRPATSGLPVARLAESLGRSSAHHVITPIDDHGRLADRSVPRAMQWPPGTPLSMQRRPDAVVITVDHSSPVGNISRQGHLWLPAAIRRAYRLDAGDRLLLVAFPAAGVLAIFPVVQLDRIVLGWLQDQTGEVTT